MSSLRTSNKYRNNNETENETKEELVSDVEDDEDGEYNDEEDDDVNDDDNYDEQNEDNIATDNDDGDDVEDDDEDDINAGDDDTVTGTANGTIREDENIINDDVEDDEDEDEESGLVESDYLQKFTSEKNKNYIKDFHPELSSHNYEEVKFLSVITRDKNGIIIDPLHKTTPILTKFEKTRILGQRAKQIDSGATPLVDVPKNIIDGYVIAKMELARKKIPFIIKRPIPNGGCEYWNVNDLEDLTG